MDKVLFPKHKKMLEYSKELLYFFENNDIDTGNEYFDLNLLRKLFNSDIKLFYKLKNELELRGFNFEPNNNFFQKNIDYDDFEYLYTEQDSIFSPYELQKMGLWFVMTEFNKYNKKSLNYVPFQRIESIAKYKNNLRDLLAQSGYKIIHSSNNGYNNSDIADSYDFNEVHENNITEIFISTELLCFLSVFKQISSQLRRFLYESGFSTISSLIDFDDTSFHELLLSYSNQNDYTLNTLFTAFSKFKKYIKELKNEHNFDQEELQLFLTKYSFASKYYSHSQIKENFLYVDEFQIQSKKQDFLRSVNVYKCELRILKKSGIINIESLLRLNLDTRLDHLFTLEMNISDHYYDFKSLLERLIGSFTDVSVEDPLHEQFNVSILNDITSKNVYLQRISIGYNKDSIKMLSLRDKGMTLQEISSFFGVTRERVRQIQKKFATQNENLVMTVANSVISKFNYLPYDVVLDYPGFVSTLLYNGQLKYDQKIGVFSSEKLLLAVNKAIDEFNGDMEDLVKEIDNKYKMNIGFYVKKYKKNSIVESKITLKEIAEEFLLKKGLIGWKINQDQTEIHEFYAAYNRKKMSDRSIVAHIIYSDNAILYDIGTYIHKEYINLGHISAMEYVIDNVIFIDYGIPVRVIFEENKEYLISKGVLNYSYFYGLIKSYYKKTKLTFSGRSMRIGLPDSKYPQKKLIYDYISKNNNMVNINKITSDLKIDYSGIQQSKNVYKLDAQTIVTNKFFSITSIQNQILIYTIDKFILAQGYCHTQNILDELYFNSNFNDFFKKNQVGMDQDRLIYVLSYYYNDKYSISIRTKSLANKGEDIVSFSDLVKIHFKEKTFTLFELKQCFETLSIKSDITQSNIIKHLIVKVDEYHYKMLDELSVDEIDIVELESVMTKYFTNQKIVFSKEIIWRLKQHNLLEELWQNESLLATLINKSPLPWQKVNINFFTNAFSNSDVMLYRNGGEKREINIDEVIIDFIGSKDDGYLTLEDINQILYDYEIAPTRVPDSILLTIFEEYNKGGLIRVTKNV